MKMLFIGGIFKKDEVPGILANSKGVIQFAADAVQWRLIHGFDRQEDLSVDILNGVFVGSYPKRYKKFLIGGKRWSHQGDSLDKDMFFLNLPVIKHIWRTLSATLNTVAWVRKNKGVPKSMVIYSVHSPFVIAAVVAKWFDCKTHVSLIVPDLPEFMMPGGRQSIWYVLFKSLDSYVLSLFLRMVDSYVLFTEQMASKLNRWGKPWIVMEGLVDEVNDEQVKLPKSDQKVILYTGTLNKAYGIMDLLHAFKLIQDPDYRLWICGAGEVEIAIKERSKVDSRINYMGQLAHSEILTLQKKATLLVNPRTNEGEYTQYSFPSKTIEYLFSGTPTLLHPLDGIPEEYYKYVYLFENNEIEEMAKKIVTICSQSQEELDLFGRKAFDFIKNEKNNMVQTSRIVKLMRDSMSHVIGG